MRRLGKPCEPIATGPAIDTASIETRVALESIADAASSTLGTCSALNSSSALNTRGIRSVVYRRQLRRCLGERRLRPLRNSHQAVL